MLGPRETSHELENLAGLLNDFGAEGWTGERAAEAFEVIAARTLQLESQFEEDVRFVEYLTEEHDLGLVLEPVTRSVHSYIFEGILTNAGEYRRADDPGKGYVAFGGMKGQGTQPRFTGAPAHNLEYELGGAYAHLEDLRAEAFDADAEVREGARREVTDAAVLYYKDFSGVHPFYDANGRVGRYIVTVYLFLHGRYVRWRDLDAKEIQFLKKINECLKRANDRDPALLTEYEGYLTSFWRQFVEDIPDEG